MSSLHSYRRLVALIIAVSSAAGLMPAGGEDAVSPKRPFPQHVSYCRGSIKPGSATREQLDSSTIAFYNLWRAKYLVKGFRENERYVSVAGPRGPAGRNAICVSEGQGYGMLITALMAGYDPEAREYFDALFRFYRSHPSRINPRLMAWRQMRDGNSSEDSDSAADGDLDIAYALLLADVQWGSDGDIDYRAEAHANIRAVKSDEINSETWSVKLGDWVQKGGKHYYGTRTSDFMVEHFRAFGSISGDKDWLHVADTCYAIIETMQESSDGETGLVPDFVVSLDTKPAPAGPGYLSGKHDGDFYYNACRVPFRLGVDYLLNGDKRAAGSLRKLNAWIHSSTGGDPSEIRAGYTLDGNAIDDDDRSMAFTACLAVGAMSDPSRQAWLDSLWDSVAGASIASEGYYGNTLKMLCMIVLSGNWWSPMQADIEE